MKTEVAEILQSSAQTIHADHQTTSPRCPFPLLSGLRRHQTRPQGEKGREYNPVIKDLKIIQLVEAKKQLRSNIPQTVIERGNGRKVNHASAWAQKTADIPKPLTNIKYVLQRSEVEHTACNSVVLLRNRFTKVDPQGRTAVEVDIAVVINS